MISYTISYDISLDENSKNLLNSQKLRNQLSDSFVKKYLLDLQTIDTGNVYVELNCKGLPISRRSYNVNSNPNEVFIDPYKDEIFTTEEYIENVEDVTNEENIEMPLNGELYNAISNKLNELEEAFKKAMTIVFWQGIDSTREISLNDLMRDSENNEIMIIDDHKYFFDVLSKIENTNDYNLIDGDNVIKFYRNRNSQQELVAISYFWRIALFNKFMTKINTFPVSVKDLNVREYDYKISKIKNSKQINEINNIVFEFLTPNGLIINVEKLAEDILNNKNIPQIIKNSILQRKGKDGFIRLFNKY